MLQVHQQEAITLQFKKNFTEIIRGHWVLSAQTQNDMNINRNFEKRKHV